MFRTPAPRRTRSRATVTAAALVAAAALVGAASATANAATAARTGTTASGTTASDATDRTLRVATFNASLNRSAAGALVSDLSTPDNAQAKAVAEVIQRADPDLLLINEFDFVEGGLAAQLFRDNYLERPQNGADPVGTPTSSSPR